MHAMFRTLDSRHPGVEIGRMLEEIQVAPDLLLGIVDRAFLATGRARKTTALRKVHMQVQALVLHRKPHIIHRPRRH
jgi:hypothetical protein